jgi:hypothetical protein
MRLVLAAAMAAVLCTSAKAQVGVDEFQQFCMATRADRALALAAADKAGWMPIPKAMMDKFPAGEFKDPDARMRSGKDAMLFLIVGHGKPMTMPGEDLQICGVGAAPPSADGFNPAAVEISGVEKFGDSSNGLFFWREEAGKHIRLAVTDVKAAVEAHNFNVIVTHSTEKVAMIMFATQSQTLVKASP